MDKNKKCVFCGKPALWDNFGGICGDCYSQKEQEEAIKTIEKNAYKKVLKIVEEEIKQNRPADFKINNIKRILEDLSH